MALECNLGQGFWFDRPLDPAAMGAAMSLAYRLPGHPRRSAHAPASDEATRPHVVTIH
jgi:hypothetical protein